MVVFREERSTQTVTQKYIMRNPLIVECPGARDGFSPKGCGMWGVGYSPLETL